MLDTSGAVDNLDRADSTCVTECDPAKSIAWPLIILIKLSDCCTQFLTASPNSSSVSAASTISMMVLIENAFIPLINGEFA